MFLLKLEPTTKNQSNIILGNVSIVIGLNWGFAELLPESEKPGQEQKKPKVLLFDLQVSKLAEEHMKTCKDCQDRYKQANKKIFVITLHISQEKKHEMPPA